MVAPMEAVQAVPTAADMEVAVTAVAAAEVMLGPRMAVCLVVLMEAARDLWKVANMGLAVMMVVVAAEAVMMEAGCRYCILADR